MNYDRLFYFIQISKKLKVIKTLSFIIGYKKMIYDFLLSCLDRVFYFLNGLHLPLSYRHIVISQTCNLITFQ